MIRYYSREGSVRSMLIKFEDKHIHDMTVKILLLVRAYFSCQARVCRSNT